MQQVTLKLGWYGRIVLTVIALLLLGLVLKPHYTVERVIRVDQPSQGGVTQVALGDELGIGRLLEYKTATFGGPKFPLVVEVKTEE